MDASSAAFAEFMRSHDPGGNGQSQGSSSSHNHLRPTTSTAMEPPLRNDPPRYTASESSLSHNSSRGNYHPSFHQQPPSKPHSPRRDSCIEPNDRGGGSFRRPLPLHHRSVSAPGGSTTSRHRGEIASPPLRDPRPSRRAGRPPPPATKPVAPNTLRPRLGPRGLLLAKPSQASSNAAAPPRIPRQLGPTLALECPGCGDRLEDVPKHAIALECPNQSCGKTLWPTVVCRALVP